MALPGRLERPWIAKHWHGIILLTDEREKKNKDQREMCRREVLPLRAVIPFDTTRFF